MLWMVVPVFAKMFKDMDAELPAITQFVVDASDYIVEVRHLRRRSLIVACVFGFKRYLKTDAGPPVRRRRPDGRCPASASS